MSGEQRRTHHAGAALWDVHTLHLQLHTCRLDNTHHRALGDLQTEYSSSPDEEEFGGKTRGVEETRLALGSVCSSASSGVSITLNLVILGV